MTDAMHLLHVEIAGERVALCGLLERSGERLNFSIDAQYVTCASCASRLTLPGDLEVAATCYTISRIPDTSFDYTALSIKVEGAGHGRWAIRHLGSCLNKQGEWEWEPSPSSRTAEWLATARWDSLAEAIAIATKVEPTLAINGLTASDVLARRGAGT